MDTIKSDNIYADPKTPRRSIRLKVTSSTPVLNTSLQNEVLLRRSTRKIKTEGNILLVDSISQKNKKRKYTQSTLENRTRNTDNKENKKKKQRKGKKSNKKNKSKGEESENTENDSNKNPINVTFDKESSSNSDCGELYIPEFNISKNKSVNYFKEVEKSSSQTPMEFSVHSQEKSKTSIPKILHQSESKDLWNDTSSKMEEEHKSNKCDESTKSANSSFGENDNKHGPLANVYGLLNCSNENGNASFIEERNASTKSVEDEINCVEKTSKDTLKSFEENSTKQDQLEDDNSFRNEDENTSLNKEKDLNAIPNLVKANCSPDIVVTSDECGQNTFNKEENDYSLTYLTDTKQEVNVNVINKSVDANQSDICLGNLKSPKFLIQKERSVMKQTITVTPKSKRLQSDELKNSISKNSLKKSISNRVSTPFHRNRSVEKKVGESKRSLNVSLAQQLLKSNIVTPVSTLKIGEQFRSIRKRSYSESEKNKKINRVTFHSPSNVEIPLEDIDTVMKDKKEGEASQKKINNIYITERRKRSLSVAGTESERANIVTNLGLGTEECTPSKLENLPPASVSRGKMPNFSAIHQQKFNKMESISEHIARKAERAKFLISSTTKNNTGSTVKTQMETKTSSAAKKIASKTHAIPKARQRIELSNVKDTKRDKDQIKMSNVPLQSVPKSSALTEPMGDKMKSRQQKNIQLYKGRPQINQKTKRQEIVRGVRSNRRFELQMMCRNRPDNKF